MRKSRNGQRRAFAAFTKFSVLLMCFATVFALVLTAGVFDIGGSDMNANVAEASTSGGSVNAMTFSTAADGSELVTQVQNDMHSSKTGDFTYTINLGDQGVSAQSYTSIHGWGDGAKPVQYYSSGKNSSFGGQETEKHGGVNYTSLQVALNIQTPQIFLNWASRYKIDITFSGTLYTCNEGQGWLGGGNNCGFGMGIVGSGSAMNANTFASYFWCDGSDHKDGEGKFYLDNWREPAGWITNDSTYWNGVLFDTNGNTVSLSNTMTNLTAVLFRESGGSENTGIYAENVYFTFTIHKDSVTPSNNASDNNAPRAELASAVDESYITADNIGNYAQGELIGSIGQIAGAPVLSNNHVDLTAGATRKGSIGVDGVDNKYAKKVQLNINEINADGGNASVTQATYYAGLAGITVGGNELSPTLYPTSAQGAVQNGAFSYGGGSDNGYFVWKVNDQGRTSGTLTLYFNDNVENLDIKVADSGGTALTLTVTVDGIKTGGDDLTGSASITDGTRMTDANSATFDGLTWEWDDLTPVFANMGSGLDEQIWFFAVQRYDNEQAALGALGTKLYPGTEGGSGLQPIGYSVGGELTRLSGTGYDFDSGTFDGAAPINGVSATGSGWYRFEFYPMNYAGYIGKPVVRLVKADVAVGEVEVVLNYSPEKNGTLGRMWSAGDTDRDCSITFGEALVEAGAYVGTDLTAKVSFAPNFSGNRVHVLGADGEDYIVYVSGGAITGIYGADGISAATGWTKADGVWSMAGGAAFGGVKVSVASADDKVVLSATYTGLAGDVVEEVCDFRVYSNADDKGALDESVNNMHSEWGSGATLNIDLAAPAQAVSGNGFVIKNDKNTIPAGTDRKWYTDSNWTLDADMTVTGEYDTLYYVAKYYNGKTTTEGNTDFSDGRGDYEDIYNAASLDLSGFADEGHMEVTDGKHSLHLDFNSIAGKEKQAGYYVVYVVVKDRAGNVSELGVFGVLADGHDYKISVEIDQDTLKELGSSPYDLKQIVTDEEGNVQTTFHRGETIRFVPQLTDKSYAGAYVPYEIKKYNAETGAVIDASPIYSHEDDDITSGFNADYILSGYAYARLIEGGSGLELDVDRNSVANLPIAAGGKTKLVFSYRRVMKANYNLNVPYTGERIEAKVTELFTDDNPAQKPDGSAITAKPYTVVYPDNFVGTDGITHADKYGVRIERKHSDYYVLLGEVSDTLTVTPVALNVTASMNPTKEQFYFGDMTPTNAEGLLRLEYAITSGLVGKDEAEGKEFGALHGAKIEVSIGGMQEGSYAGLGDHRVTVTLAAQDYTVTLTWGESGDSFNIAARPMSFTAESPEQVIYGDPMPTVYTVRLPKSEFAFDSAEQGGLALYQTAEQVKALIVYDVTDDGGDYYEFTLPASAFAAFEQNGAGLYNVGDYVIAGFSQGSTQVNNRLALSVAENSEGKVTVTTRTVYVSPVIPTETINVEDLSELDGRTFPINATGNPDIGAYGITGNFILGDRLSEDVPETKYTYAIKGEPADFTSAHNDTGAGYAANNIEIAFPDDTTGWKFTVHIISAAGQFVITFTSKDIFTVTYGELFDAKAIAAADGGYYTVEYFPRDGEGEPAPIPAGVTLVVTITAEGYNAGDLYANTATTYNLDVKAEAQGAPAGVLYTYACQTADGALPDYVTVKTLQATVTVSEVTALSKEYGADNFDIDPLAFKFEFSSDKGLIGKFIDAKGEISVENIGAGWDRLAKVGSYQYNWSGCTFTAGGEKISSNNIKFTVVDDGVRFEITQKVLDIDYLIDEGGLIVTAGNKPYDGNSTARATLEFGSVGENSVIIDNDDVKLSYTAEYWDGTQTVSDISSGEGYHIIFYGIGIRGADAGNYRLEGGDTVEGFAALVYVTPESGYKIDPNPINILTEHFTVSKIYDGNTGVTTGNIKITGLSLGDWVLLAGGSFAAAQAGSTMASFVIVFPDTEYPQAVLDPDGDREIDDYYTFDTFYFSVEQSDEGGIKLICSNIDATIGKKAINLGDIEFKFTAKDMTKVYNGTAGFEVPFGFTDTFAGSVTGFAAESVGLSFAGRAKSADVGEYALIIDSIGLDDDVNYEIGRDLTAENAALRINDYGTPFSITPKELRLDIVFAEASYSGENGPTAYGKPVIRGLENGESAVIKEGAAYEYVRPVVGEDGTVKYEAFPYVQTGEGYYDGATYLHDVRAGFTILVDNGFKWDNYKLDVTYEDGEAEGEYKVSGLILEKAAVLNPADVTLNVTVGGDYITVTSKIYDATNAATITIGESAYRGEFHHDDISHLKFSYTATFANANVGSGIDVSVSELALIAKEGFEYIADSYKIAAGSKSFTLKNAGTITKAPVRVQLNIPEKVYDGTRYVELSPGANIGTLLNAENGSTDWAVAGEKFADNYSVQAIAAGYDNAEVAADAGGYAKAGTVIGFKLVNDLGGAVNYYIVDADKSIAQFNAYSEEALGDKLEGALAYIAGVYSDGGELRYIIRADEVTAAGVDGIDPVTTFMANYAEGMGAIEPATVSLSVVIVDKSAFSKQFDDTSALPDQPVYGTEGDAEGTYDFYIRLSDGGTGFSFEQSDFVIRLAGAEVGNQDIIFTINRTEIGNYIFNTDNSVTVPGGEITKGKLLSVTAASSSGGDITGIYGDVGLDHIVSYTYQGDGSNPVTLTVADGYAYVTVAEWQTLFGHAVVPDEVTARRYSYNGADGKWTQADDGAYIRITGTFGTPVLSTAGGTSFADRDGVVTAAAGTYENAKLSVTSQSFNLNASSNIKVVISPRTLHIVVTNANEQGNFTADYFVGKLPKPVFAFLNENEVASLDNKNTVLGSVRGVFMDGDEPVADLNIDKDGNYVLAVSSTNGNYTVVLVDAAGETAEHKLVITIPELDTTQYKVKTNLKRQYELGADGQGVALDKSDLLNATAVADGNNIIDIKWTDANGNEIPAPSDVGTYKWALTVTKKIGGSQTYTYAGEFTANGSFTIEKRRITVSLKESVGFTYDDGKAHVITKENLTAKDADGNADEFIALISDTITYLLNGKSCTDMTDAGGYTVVLEFVDSPNYELVNNVGTVYVKAKPITVKVDPASKVYDATNGINGNVGISFTAEGADASDFSVVYRSAGNVVGAITTPGIYTYTIVSKDPNYTVSGESTGNFNVQISKVTYTKDDIDYVTIAFGSPVAVNYYLNDTAVAQGSGYWNIVDANVQKLAGEDGGLVTNGIIRIEMSNNNGVVSTVPGGVTVTARIPAGVGSDFTLYRVTSSGGLEVVEDYTVANGVVTYTTDYISNLVFVGTAPVAGFPWWIIPIIAAALVLTLALAILIAVLVKLHRAPDPIPVEVTPIDSIMPEPPVPAPAAPVAPVIVEVPAADIAPTVYDAPAAVSKHKQPPIIGIR